MTLWSAAIDLLLEEPNTSIYSLLTSLLLLVFGSGSKVRIVV